MSKRKLPQRILSATVILFLGGMMMFGLFGCGAKKYHVDYGTGKSFYENAKDSYRAGERVTVYYNLIATDTDYSFYLDDEPINYGYSHEHGFELTFVMPEHDVRLTCKMKNSMEYNPEPDSEEEELLVDYYRATVATVGGDGYSEYTLYPYDGEKLRLLFSESCEDGKENEESRLVDQSVLNDCMRVIEEGNMAHWNELNDPYPAMLGAVAVVKFQSESGDCIRVSSDKMPENGSEFMNRVEGILSAAFQEGEIIG